MTPQTKAGQTLLQLASTPGPFWMNPEMVEEFICSIEIEAAVAEEREQARRNRRLLVCSDGEMRLIDPEHEEARNGEVITGRRLYDLKDEADHDWLAGYFSGYHAVPMHLNDKKALVARCYVLQRKVTAHHRRDHVTAKTCEVCPDD